MGITAMLEEVYGVQFWLLMMTMGATLAYALVLQSVCRPLRSVGAPAPAGILSLEFAWTAERVNQIIADWSKRAVRGHAVLSLWLDYGFILVYSAALAVIGVGAVETLIPEPILTRHLVLGLFLLGVAAAAVCDAVENGLHLWFLYGHPPARDTLPALASHCARYKFAILIHLVIAALVAWVVGMVLPR
jgi:hypothetical protein